MGANSTQGIAIAAFLLGFTFLSWGMMGGGMLLYLLAVVLLIASFAGFMKCKPLEHIEK